MSVARTGAAPELFRNTNVTLDDGRQLVTGVEFSVVGEAGRFRFHHQYKDGSLTAWGPLGDGKSPQWRAFKPEQVRTVHKTRTAPKGAK